ncbi:MAG TPA: hypothetical protein VFE22_15290 [Edaphobacter sp.]|jgi:hypothetical protein|nr:hypothetical protein [Edaphobacter sp.]
MKWITKILREIFGLFVEDGSFALSIMVWIAVVYWTAPHLDLAPAVTTTIFFVGLALILGESTLRYSRRRNPRK